jgi:riboflavin kinase
MPPTSETGPGVNPKRITVLKEIALLGGTRSQVPMSSRELGEGLGMSQQSASKYLLELLDEGLITRRLGARRQVVQLSEKGLGLLRREYSEYQRIFEEYDRLVIKGTVTTGLGEGQYYVTQKGYADQFRCCLGFDPYKGTLNLRIEQVELSKVQALRDSAGIPIEGFKTGKRTFGRVKCFKGTIGDLPCAVVMPNRSHYSDTVEVLAETHLRDGLGLKDGDVVELIVEV